MLMTVLHNDKRRRKKLNYDSLFGAHIENLIIAPS